MVKKIENINYKYDKALKSKKESYERKNQIYTSLLKQREMDKNLNENILKFQKVSADLKEKQKQESYYKDLREKSEKSAFAKNIKNN